MADDPNAGDDGDTAGGGDKGTGGDTSFLGTLPEDIRGDASLADFKDVGGLAKSYVHSQKMIGDRISVPKPDAEGPEWDTFFTKLGRPSEAKGYELKVNEKLATEGGDSKLIEGFADTAFAAGLSRTQANKLATWYQETAIAELAEMQTNLQGSMDEAEAGLRKQFGDAYEPKLAVAQKAVATFTKMAGVSEEEAKAFLESSGVPGNNPTFLRMMSAIGEAMSEDTLGPALQRGGFGAMTPEAAKRRINEIHADPASMNPQDPKHGDLVAELEKLTSQAYPGSEEVLISGP